MAARTAPARARRGPKVAVPEDLPPSWEPVPPPATPSKPEVREPVHEPVWLVRFVLVLFLIGFAAFLAREVANLRDVLP